MTPKPLSTRLAIAFIALAGAALLSVLAYVLISRSPAPDVEFTTLEGERISMRDLRGKVVYVNFCGAIAAAFDHVNLTPTAVIVDKQGKVLRRIVGEPDFASLHALIEKELAE